MASNAEFKQAAECHNGVVYRTATAEDADAIACLCLSDFYPRMPLMQHLGATTAQDVATTLGILPVIIGQGLSLVAEDATTKELIGARLSMSESRTEQDVKHPLLTDSSLAEKFPKHATVLRLVDRIESQVDYFQVFNVNKALAFKLLLVKQSRGKSGIGRRLVEVSMRMAKLAGIDLAVASTQNWHAQRIYESLGFQRLAAIQYREYTDKVTGEKPFAGLANSSEHQETVMFAKLL